MIKYILCIVIPLILCGCATVATRDSGETLRIEGIGKAEWADGAKIEGKPMISFPQLPDVEFDK